MEEVKAHCERCHDDKNETKQVQEERIQEQRHTGDSLVAWTGRKVENKANGLGDCLATEMVQELPMECVYEVTHWFEK